MYPFGSFLNKPRRPEPPHTVFPGMVVAPSSVTPAPVTVPHSSRGGFFTGRVRRPEPPHTVFPDMVVAPSLVTPAPVVAPASVTPTPVVIPSPAYSGGGGGGGGGGGVFWNEAAAPTSEEAASAPLFAQDDLDAKAASAKSAMPWGIMAIVGIGLYFLTKKRGRN